MKGRWCAKERSLEPARFSPLAPLSMTCAAESVQKGGRPPPGIPPGRCGPSARAVTQGGREQRLSLYTPVIVKYRDSKTKAASGSRIFFADATLLRSKELPMALIYPSTDSGTARKRLATSPGHDPALRQDLQ